MSRLKDNARRRIAEALDSRKAILTKYRDAALRTSARDMFNKLNAEADRLAQGLTGRYREEYESMKAKKLAEADAKDRADRGYWDKIIARG